MLPLPSTAWLTSTESRASTSKRKHSTSARSLRQQSLGSQHLEVAETLHELARCYQMHHQTTKAFSLYQQSLAIREQALGLHHPKTVATRMSCTHLLQEKEQTEELSGPYREACQAVYPTSLESDALRGFLDACCELHPRALCRFADLWQAYKHRVKDHQERYPLSRGAFIAQLKAHAIGMQPGTLLARGE